MKTIRVILVLAIAAVMGAVLFKALSRPKNEERILECAYMTCTKQECPENSCCNSCGCESWATKDKEGLAAAAAEGYLPYNDGIVDGCGRPQHNLLASGYKKGKVFYAVKWTVSPISQNLPVSQGDE
ncbi:MAG: hypothetical protein Q8O13_08045 [Candidatus Omnitrophota bacterium]|nr:hypothetical protein [Candidatus Omnitrophota bacterium]